ncbi:TIM-barrel domain-containing protein [Brachybacterium sp. YJGR34]|uniref:glycoside hydrolase family 31 protein n=1 Tax=Brachybacterium sp. YJGR34 TaxID=2059911 RepID=UPI000E0C7177|nr:TIM-barrel domain-containing protein [Brachybacterium sp. YJGR34]
MRTSTQVQEISLDAAGVLHVGTEGVALRVLMMTEDVVRVRAGFDGDFAEQSYSLMTTAWEDGLDEVYGSERTRLTPPPVRLEENEDAAILHGPRLRVEVRRSPLEIRVLDADGSVLHADVPYLAYREDVNGRRIHTRRIEPGDAFVGFGETTGALDKAKQLVTLSPRDSLGYDAENSSPLYKHIPFHLTVNRSTQRASGYFFHGTHDVSFDLGRSHSNYFPHHSQVIADGGDIDYFVIAGPAVRDVVARYTELTGRPPVLPRQALGYLASSMYYAELDADSDQAITRFVDRAQEHGIPVDGFQLSSGYTTQDTADGAKRCVFTWNRDRFPDPERFFSDLAERGVVVSPNVKPGILRVHPQLEEFARRDVFVGASEDAIDQSSATAPELAVDLELAARAGTRPAAVGAWWGGPGHFVDFTAPRAREAWKQWLTEAVLAQGTASVWNDNCEYEGVLDLDSRVAGDGAPTTLAAARNVMSNLMCRVTEEAIAEAHPEQRPFIVCRAGHAGIQRYAQTWAGDNSTSWTTLRANIATILGMSLSGVANQGCDIGGFHGPRPEPELLLRWVQHGIFQPRFSIHSVNSDNTVTEPWMYPEITPLIREAIQLRYRLIPYLYSLMVRASREGAPIMEPLLSAFQHDALGYDTTDVFMLGDSLLVATVLEKGAETRTVRFPAGEVFYDLTTRQRHEGGTTHVEEVGPASIPLYLRAGGILPIAVEQPTSLVRDEIETLRLLCAPERDGSFVLHEDDGHSRAHERGERRETRVTMRAGSTVRISLERTGAYRSAVRTLLFDVIHPDRAPLRVLRDGQLVPHRESPEDLLGAESGWYYDAALGSVRISLPDDGEDLELEISFDTFDMIGM